MHSSTEPSMPLTTEEPPMANRLKPPTDQDQTLVHCPRCDSPNTKFCYYNNYSLTQPRYFCKACRRYWTKGGTLRNIPIGGVSRKNKKVTHRRRRELQPQQNSHYDKVAVLSDGLAMSPNSTGLQLLRPESPVQFAENPDFMFEDLTIDFMERGDGIRNYNGGDYFPSTIATSIGRYMPNSGYEPDTRNIYGPSPLGETMSCYDHEHYEKLLNGDDVKPKLFDLEWRDQTGCYSDVHASGVGRNGSSGYLLGLGSSWPGLVNGYGSSSTNSMNSLV